MASNWTTYKIGDLFELQNGFAFKGTDFIDEGVPVIKIKNVKAGKILLSDLSYVSREVADKAKRFLIKPNDILITMSGNRMDGSPETWVGKVSLFQEAGEYLLNQRVGILKPKLGVDVNVEFCAYSLSSWYYQNHFINAANSSGGQANISPSTILNTDIYLPDRDTQNEISSVLKSLDESIRNNESIISISEEITRVLFREWFGNKLTTITSQATESEFINSPADWVLGPIGKLASIQNGYSFKSDDFEPSGHNAVIKIKNISNNTVDISKTDFVNESIVKNTDKKFQIYSGSLLIAMTGAEVGKIGFVPDTSKKLWLNQRVGMFIEKIKYSSYYLFLLLSTDLYQSSLQNAALGSAQPNISGTAIENIKALIPPHYIIKEFGEIADPFFQLRFSKITENHDLSKLKESLVPYLTIPNEF